jgi:hypothetical protein
MICGINVVLSQYAIMSIPKLQVLVKVELVGSTEQKCRTRGENKEAPAEADGAVPQKGTAPEDGKVRGRRDLGRSVYDFSNLVESWLTIS